ncbi:hypothetical protein LJR034_005216 [Caballeronia sp. LjRoot34]|uniref:hypothetical protein n=1 Tax=Caballeronia sp. LjRoot34 TaxID=3342325 RepID=UPI003ECE294D
MKRLKQYKTTIIAVMLFGLLIVYPFMVMVLNPVPPEQALTRYVGWVSLSRYASDQVRVRLADGRTLDVAFPSANYSTLKGYGESVVSTESKQHLKDGCAGTVSVDRTKVLFPIVSVSRVWKLECKSGELGYLTLSHAYQDVLRGTYWIDGVANVLALMFIVLIALVDRKRLSLAQRIGD